MEQIFRTLKPGGVCYIHFNIEIKDDSGRIDYSHDEDGILKLVSQFNILRKKNFERVDERPVKHTHKILELILQKSIQSG